MKSVWFDEFPPFMVRILARQREGARRTPLCVDDIAKACGKSRRWVNYVSRLDSWDTMTYAAMKRFARACQMDPAKLYRDREYLARSMVGAQFQPLAHIQSLPDDERAWMDALIQAKKDGILQILQRLFRHA